MELTTEELLRLLCQRPVTQTHSLEIGEAYLFRTVTHYYTGRVESVTDTDVRLSSAAWIADTGRYSEALTKGTLRELEPYPGDGAVILNRSAFVEMAPWTHDLPRVAK